MKKPQRPHLLGLPSLVLMSNLFLNSRWSALAQLRGLLLDPVISLSEAHGGRNTGCVRFLHEPPDLSGLGGRRSMARARRTANWSQYLSDRAAFRSYRRRRPRFQEPFSGFWGCRLIEKKNASPQLILGLLLQSGAGNALIKTFLRIYFHFVRDWILWICGSIRKLSDLGTQHSEKRN